MYLFVNTLNIICWKLRAFLWTYIAACPMMRAGRFGALPLTVCSRAWIWVELMAVVVAPEEMIHSAEARPTKRSVCAASHWIGPRPGAFSVNDRA